MGSPAATSGRSSVVGKAAILPVHVIIGCMSVVTTRPPGRSTLANSAYTGARSSTCESASPHTTKSTELLSTGNAWSRPEWNVPLGTLARARSNIASVASTPMTFQPIAESIAAPGSTRGVECDPGTRGTDELAEHRFLGLDRGIRAVVARRPHRVARVDLVTVHVHERGERRLVDTANDRRDLRGARVEAVRVGEEPSDHRESFDRNEIVRDPELAWCSHRQIVRSRVRVYPRNRRCSGPWWRSSLATSTRTLRRRSCGSPRVVNTMCRRS